MRLEKNLYKLLTYHKVDNSKLQVIINVNDENKDIDKKHTVKNKSYFLNKMRDNNILSTKNLLQDRKIFNYM